MNFYEIDKKLKAEFASKRLEAESKAERNLARLSKILSYTKLDTLSKELMLEISKKGGKASKKDKELLENVKKQKQFVLASLGLSEDDLSPKYQCKKCNDFGFLGAKMCSCYQKRRNEEIMKACGLTFEHKHSLKNYSTKICGNEAQAKQLDDLKTFLKNWINRFPAVTKQNILIMGKTGVGKTYLAEAVATDIFEKNYSVCFVSAFDMNNMFTKFHTTFSTDKHSWIDPLIESDLLIIDDLGTEPITKNVTLNYLYLVLCERNRFGKATIITTNLSAETIMDRYGERIFSRLMDKSNGLAFGLLGDDLRTKK